MIRIALYPRPDYAGLMARLSRITVPGLPHHVTQRGNRRQALFTAPGDYALYRDLLGERCRANGVACWAYCLMPNHVHLVLTPAGADALSRAVGEAHRRFTAFVNARARTTGHLFQGRFASFAMDDAHFLNALRYLAFNPVRAGLAASPEAWPWSSVRAHLRGARRRAGRGPPGAGAGAAVRRSPGNVAGRAGGARRIREPESERAPARRCGLHRDGREEAWAQGPAGQAGAKAARQVGSIDMGNSYHVPVMPRNARPFLNSTPYGIEIEGRGPITTPGGPRTDRANRAARSALRLSPFFPIEKPPTFTGPFPQRPNRGRAIKMVRIAKSAAAFEAIATTLPIAFAFVGMVGLARQAPAYAQELPAYSDPQIIHKKLDWPSR